MSFRNQLTFSLEKKNLLSNLFLLENKDQLKIHFLTGWLLFQNTYLLKLTLKQCKNFIDSITGSPECQIFKKL